MKLYKMFSLSSSAMKNTSLSSLTPCSSFKSSPIRFNFSNFVSLRKSSFSVNPISAHGTAIACSYSTNGSCQHSVSQGGESFFRNVLASMEAVYLNRNPTAKSVLELVLSADNDQIFYDHFAFRTFGINGYGIDSMAQIFLDFGYTTKEELRFPAKKLKALWFSPPSAHSLDGGSGVNGPLPRIFISELLVDQMSPEAQGIIKKYTEISGNGNKHAAIASALGSLTWGKPSYSEFQKLARESEYAAWTLVNGYALNHVTISVHRLKTHLRSIKSLNQFIEENGFKLNSEGGNLKVSPDGLLLQSSTVADSTPFQFSDGKTETVPSCYIEFAERLVLSEYRSMPEEELKEWHRRDGFEVGNADKIFESTSQEQLTRKTAD